MRNHPCSKCRVSNRLDQFPPEVRKGIYPKWHKAVCLKCIAAEKEAEAQRQDAEVQRVAEVQKQLENERWWDENQHKVLQWQKEYSLEFVVAKLKDLGLQRQAAQLQATPHWADPKKIDAIYAEAARLTKETGIPHHVDHMVPIQGPIAKHGPFRGMRLVYGLHCEANLQILPGSENMSKGNRYWPDMPEEFSRMGKMLRKVA